MIKEMIELRDRPVPFKFCPICKHKFIPFMRGKVQRSRRSIWLFGKRRDYCALICYRCRSIVGWESPPGWIGPGVHSTLDNRVR